MHAPVANAIYSPTGKEFAGRPVLRLDLVPVMYYGAFAREDPLGRLAPRPNLHAECKPKLPT